MALAQALLRGILFNFSVKCISVWALFLAPHELVVLHDVTTSIFALKNDYPGFFLLGDREFPTVACSNTLRVRHVRVLTLCILYARRSALGAPELLKTHRLAVRHTLGRAVFTNRTPFKIHTFICADKLPVLFSKKSGVAFICTRLGDALIVYNIHSALLAGVHALVAAGDEVRSLTGVLALLVIVYLYVLLIWTCFYAQQLRFSVDFRFLDKPILWACAIAFVYVVLSLRKLLLPTATAHAELIVPVFLVLQTSRGAYVFVNERLFISALIDALEHGIFCLVSELAPGARPAHAHRSAVAGSRFSEAIHPAVLAAFSALADVFFIWIFLALLVVASSCFVHYHLIRAAIADTFLERVFHLQVVSWAVC